MNSQHFGRDPADIQIRIRINPEIRIQIPDKFSLRLWRWQRFALFEHSRCEWRRWQALHI